MLRICEIIQKRWKKKKKKKTPNEKLFESYNMKHTSFIYLLGPFFAPFCSPMKNSTKITKLRAFSLSMHMFERMYPTTWTKLDSFFSRFSSVFVRVSVIAGCCCCCCWLLISSSSFSVFFIFIVILLWIMCPYAHINTRFDSLSARMRTSERMRDRDRDINLVNVNVLACCYWRRFVAPLLSAIVLD